MDRTVARAGLTALLLVLLAHFTAEIAAAQGRRIVDAVKVGDPASERLHDFAGEGVSDGFEAGRAFRRASRWQRYSLSVYDDSEVTLSMTFRGSEGRRERFALMVEGRDAGSHTVLSASAEAATIEIRLPAAMTAGRSALIVVLGDAGGPAPGLIELRAVQEHLEHRPIRPCMLLPSPMPSPPTGDLVR